MDLAAHHIPNTDWPTIDLCTAGGLSKSVRQHGNGMREHQFADRRTAQSWGSLGVTEAGRIGVALSRLRGLRV
jgi:hypothetical protein